MSTEEYQPTEEMAATESEGGLVDLTEEDWPNRGRRPDNLSDAGYNDDKEPLAETDNWWNTDQRENDLRVNFAMGTVADRVSAIEDELDQLEAWFMSHDHDDRYYLQTETYSTGQADDRFVNEDGDLMTDHLMFEPAKGIRDEPGGEVKFELLPHVTDVKTRYGNAENLSQPEGAVVRMDDYLAFMDSDDDIVRAYIDMQSGGRIGVGNSIHVGNPDFSDQRGGYALDVHGDAIISDEILADVHHSDRYFELNEIASNPLPSSGGVTMYYRGGDLRAVNSNGDVEIVAGF